MPSFMGDITKNSLVSFFLDTVYNEQKSIEEMKNCEQESGKCIYLLLATLVICI